MRATKFVILLTQFLCWLAVLPASAAELQPVSVEIVLAVDVSNSVSLAEHRAQIEGIASAFENQNLQRVIANLPRGNIAVTLLLWAGKKQQIFVVPWKKIDGRRSALRFAAAVRRRQAKPWQGLSYTAIGDALMAAGHSLEANQYIGERKVIDISSDDPSNRGLDPPIARDLLVAKNITINGLPVLADRPDQETRQELVDYFRKNVVGGPRSFVNPALSFNHYAAALYHKLITEISGLPPTTGDYANWLSEAYWLAWAPADLSTNLPADLKVTPQLLKPDN